MRPSRRVTPLQMSAGERAAPCASCDSPVLRVITRPHLHRCSSKRLVGWLEGPAVVRVLRAMIQIAKVLLRAILPALVRRRSCSPCTCSHYCPASA